MITNKVSNRYSKCMDKVQSPIKNLNELIQLNLSGMSSQSNFMSQLGTKQFTDRGTEIQAGQSNIRNLLGSSLRSSHSNQLFSPRLAELSNLDIESPKIKSGHQLYTSLSHKGKENKQNQEIQQQVEEMKVNYIKTSLTLNQQLNDNTKLISCIQKLQEQQSQLTSSYNASKSQSLHSSSKSKLQLKKNKSRDQLTPDLHLLEVIKQQQQTIKDLKHQLQKERTEKTKIATLCNQLYLKQVIQGNSNKSDKY